ncbi:MAG: PQQ-binding-like beta-propeller repeat protein [Vicinamibacterales bacterium]
MARPRHRVNAFLAGAAALGLAVALGAAFPSARQAESERPWIGYSGSAAGGRFFGGSGITKANVNRLEVAWTYPYSDTLSTPMMVRGTIYGRGRNGALVAIDAKTGKEIWVREQMDGMTQRGVNYWESADGSDRRLLFSMNDYLQAIDAKTGKLITTFGDNGAVDLREGLERDPATIPRIQSQTPGQVFENLLLIGSAPGEGYMSPPGHVRAFDVVTGKQVWRFNTIPQPGEFGYDTGRQTPTSTPAPSTRGVSCRWTRSAGLPTSRPGRPPTTTTAPTGPAPTCSAPASSPSMPAPASESGTSSSCTTISGTTTPARRRS